MKERLRTLLGILFPPTIEWLTGDEINPCKAHEHDACDDVKSLGSYTLYPGKKTNLVSTRQGNIPHGYFVELRPRSGLSSQGITLVGSPATIDSGFTGNWIVPLRNETDAVISIHPGERIAQFRLVRIQRWKGKIGTKAKDTARGSNGFGSSGK